MILKTVADRYQW